MKEHGFETSKALVIAHIDGLLDEGYFHYEGDDSLPEMLSHVSWATREIMSAAHGALTPGDNIQMNCQYMGEGKACLFMEQQCVKTIKIY